MRAPSTQALRRESTRFDPRSNFEESIADFMRERLEFYLRDVRGFAYDVVNAVLAAGSDDVVDAIARAEAVSEVRGSEDFVSISAAFKRMKNIVCPVLAEESRRILRLRINSHSGRSEISKRAPNGIWQC